jgi:hypothetical protein
MTDLAGASINSEFITVLPPIQANREAERRFASELSARVFGPHRHIDQSPRPEAKKNTRPAVARGDNSEMERRYKALISDLNYSPELARWILQDEKMWRAVIQHRYGPLPTERGVRSSRTRIRSWRSEGAR